MVLQQAFKNYESAWNMNLANDFLKLAQNQSSNLTYIDYDIDSQKLSIVSDLLKDNPSELVEKRQEKYHRRPPIYITNKDPKCKTRPYHHEIDSVWNKYDKY